MESNITSKILGKFAKKIVKRDQWYQALPYAIFLLLILTFYSKSVFFGYTHLDDFILLAKRSEYLENFSNVLSSFNTPTFFMEHPFSTYYRPILTWSFIVDSRIFGTHSPAGYHTTNLILHFVSSVLVYKFLQFFSKNKRLCLFLTILFVVHPALSQAVVWIPGRNDSLLLIFTLSGFLYLFKYFQTPSVKNLFFYTLFLLFALFTKESAFIILIPYYFYVIYISSKKLERRHILSFHLVNIAGVLTWLIARNMVVGGLIVDFSTMIFRAVVNFPKAFVVYIGKVFVPLNLSVLPTVESSSVSLGLVSVVIFFLTLVFAKTKKYVFFALLIIVPGLFVPLVGSNLALPIIILEHRLYLPMVGILLILSQIQAIEKISNSRALFPVIGLVVVIFYLISTNHIESFRNARAFWEKAYQSSPNNHVTLTNLGVAYSIDRDYEAARSIYKEMVDKKIQLDLAYNNLGLISIYQEDRESGEKYFLEALKVNPLNWQANVNLAYYYQQDENFDQAEKYWLKALEANPDSVDAMMNLANIYVNHKDDLERAKYFYSEAVKRGVRY